VAVEVGGLGEESGRSGVARPGYGAWDRANVCRFDPL